MSRNDRRLRRKNALKVLAGGKANKPPEAPNPDRTLPAGRLGAKLERFLQHEVASDPDLDQPTVLYVMLRLTAGLVVAMREEPPTDDILRAMDVFIGEEREARGKTLPPPPNGPEGA